MRERDRRAKRRLEGRLTGREPRGLGRGLSALLGDVDEAKVDRRAGRSGVRASARSRSN